MATVLEEYNTEELHSVVRFFVGKRTQCRGYSYRHFCFLFTVGSVCRVKRFTTGLRNSLKAVRKWQIDARPGSPLIMATEATVERVEGLIWADRKVTINSVATALRCSHSLAYSVIHDNLKFWKVWTRWVPRELKDREKNEPNGSVLVISLAVCWWRRRYT
jgi:hypothetical protein